MRAWDVRAGRRVRRQVRGQPVGDPAAARRRSRRRSRRALMAHRLAGSRFTLELTESALVADPRARVRTRCTRSSSSARRSRWTISGRAIRTSPICRSCRSTCSRSTAASSPGCSPTATRSRSSARSFSLAQALGMKTTAEGIETNELAQTLAALGCTFGQGYVYAQAARGRRGLRFLIGSQQLSDFVVGDRGDARGIGKALRDPAILDPLQQRARRPGPGGQALRDQSRRPTAAGSAASSRFACAARHRRLGVSNSRSIATSMPNR